MKIITEAEKIKLKPYWNESCEKISANLWLPTSDSFPKPNLTNNTLAQSWLSYNLINNPNPISLNNLHNSVDPSELEVIKTRKIRIYPTSKQREMFRRWMGAARYVYNQTLDYLKSLSGKRPKWTDIATYTILPALPAWAKEIPFKIKKMAVKEACDAYSAAKQKFKKTGVFSHFAYRSRKAVSQTCYIPKNAVTTRGIYPTIAGDLHYSEALPNEITDAELSWQQGRWYLCVPYKTTIKRGENQARIVALDPGVRNFLSFFSPNLAGIIGIHDFGRLVRLAHHLDKLLSKLRISRNKKQRYRMKKAANRMRWKIRDLREELHAKAARFLVNNFDVILLPSFETSQMVQRGKRKLSSKSVRSLLTWAHFMFKQRLKELVAQEGKILIEVNEAYTSQTCSWSGEIVKIGSSEIIRGKDGIVLHRDINGARGIFLRALVELPSLENFQRALAKDASSGIE
jgi:putative transposase